MRVAQRRDDFDFPRRLARRTEAGRASFYGELGAVSEEACQRKTNDAMLLDAEFDFQRMGYDRLRDRD